MCLNKHTTVPFKLTRISDMEIQLYNVPILAYHKELDQFEKNILYKIIFLTTRKSK